MLKAIGLRYRGKDPFLKQFQNTRESDFSFDEFSSDSNSMLDTTDVINTTTTAQASCLEKPKQSILDNPSYQKPPKGRKISYAYYSEPDLLNDIENQGQSLIKTLFDNLKIKSEKQNFKISTAVAKSAFENVIQNLKKAPDLLKDIYKQFSKEEQEFIKYVSKEISRHHLGQACISALNIHPISFAIMSILASTGLTAAEQFSPNLVNKIKNNPLFDCKLLKENLLFCKNKLATDSNPLVSQNSTDFSFHDGIPPVNGTNYCEFTDYTLCNQFYITQNKKTVSQGFAQFSVQPLERLPEFLPAWHCGNRNVTKLALKSVLANPNVQPKLSNEGWCMITSPAFIRDYDYPDSSSADGVIINDNFANGLSEEACLEFHNKMNGTSQCISNYIPAPKMSPLTITEITLSAIAGVCLLSLGACYVAKNATQIKSKIKEKCCPRNTCLSSDSSEQSLLRPDV